MDILYELPSQNKWNLWRKIKVLDDPSRIKDIELNEEDSKESYLAKNFQEVKVGVTPERTRSLENIVQEKRKQSIRDFPSYPRISCQLKLYQDE